MKFKLNWLNRKNSLLQSLALPLLVTLGCSFMPSSVEAAERLILRIGWFQQPVRVEDLEDFADSGDLPPNLQLYSPVLNSQVRDLLRQNFYIDSELANSILDDFLKSSDGIRLIEQINNALPDSDRKNLQKALLLTITNNSNFNIISFLRAYPQENIIIDLSKVASIAIQVNSSYLQSKAIEPVLAGDLLVDTDFLSLSSNLNPHNSGNFTPLQETLVFFDRQRNREITASVYYSIYPQSPMVVMSHGFAANRFFLKYLARHLASHGFTVVSLDHPGSNINSLSGSNFNLGNLLKADEFVERPRDVSFILDELEKLNRDSLYLKGKLNTKKVIAIGHSFGGYTVLALAGGELKPKKVRSYCEKLNPLSRSPADWLQCTVGNLPYSSLNLKDKRVVGVISLNPNIGKLFGNSLEKISIPIGILASSDDGITPILNNQLLPFRQIQSDKYLLVANGATHLSVSDFGRSNRVVAENTLVKEFIGEEAKPLRDLVKGFSSAFIYQFTDEKAEYQPFLSATYVQSFSSDEISLRMTKELPNSLNLWLNTIEVSNQKIVFTRVKKNNLGFFTRVKRYVFNAIGVLPSPVSSTGKLDKILSRFLQDNYLTGG